MSTEARRGRGLQVGLTRESVIAAAERVVERDGFDTASLRGVAVELGVTPGAIYNHFGSKQELLDGVADAFVAREVVGRLPRRAAPLERVRVLCRRLHAAGTAHPSLVASIVGHLPDRVESAQLVFANQLLSALREAGAADEQVGVLYRALVTICLGNAIYDANVASLGEDERERLLRLHAESPYDEIATYVQAMPRPGDRSWLDQQLDLVLACFEARGSRP